ncbi:MAG: hypothetical protein U0P81_06235 [Holophagaceae bacterium]
MRDLLIWELLQRLGWSLPYLLVLGTGIAVALGNRAKNPSASKLACAAFGLMAFTMLFAAVYQAWLFANINSLPVQDRLQLFNRFSTSAWLRLGLDIFAWVLLLLALHRAFQTRDSDRAS